MAHLACIIIVLQEVPLPADPLESPVSLVLHGGHGVDGMEELVLLLGVLDITLQEQAVHLCVTHVSQPGI